MATAGFQIVGSHGVVQVDDTMINLQLRATGTLTSSGTGGNPDNVLSFSGLTLPLLFVRNLNGTQAIGIRSKDGVGSADYRICAPVGTQLQWYLFDVAVGPVTNTGLVVYREDGSVAFSTDQFPLRIVSALSIFSGNVRGSFTQQSLSAPGGAGTYAGCILGPRATHFQSGPINQRVLEALFTESAGMRNNTLIVPGPAGIFETQQGGTMLLADVSGI